MLRQSLDQFARHVKSSSQSSILILSLTRNYESVQQVLQSFGDGGFGGGGSGFVWNTFISGGGGGYSGGQGGTHEFVKPTGTSIQAIARSSNRIVWALL